MAFQSARQVEVIYKEQSVLGTPESGSGATGFRAHTGGLNLTKDPINSNENRRDGQRTRGRGGSRTVAGQYVADLSVESFDQLIAAPSLKSSSGTGLRRRRSALERRRGRNS